MLPLCISQVPPALAKADEPRGTPHQHDVATSYRKHTVSHQSGVEGGLLFQTEEKTKPLGNTLQIAGLS